MQSRIGSVCLLSIAGLFVSSWPRIVAAQELQQNVLPSPRPLPAGRRKPPATLRVDLKLVLVPVSVTDPMDRPVTTLPRDSFRIWEDGVQQTIAAFSQEDAPVSLGLLFDTSGSMKGRLDTSIQAMKLLFQTAIPGDEYFLVQFADNARPLGGFTTQSAEIEQQLGSIHAHGWTALLDAIALGVHQMKSAKNQSRVLLILSDGNDNNSRYSESEIRSMVLEADMRVYGIGLAHQPRFLKQLADETGGKVLIAQNQAELPAVVEKLSREVRSEYVLGYSPANANDGKYHQVKIELMPPADAPKLHASWRRGYIAPGE